MDALTVSVVSPERAGIEVEEVRRVVAVDVPVFENVALRVKHAEMSECVAYHSVVPATESLSQTRPIVWTVERLERYTQSSL